MPKKTKTPPIDSELPVLNPAATPPVRPAKLAEAFRTLQQRIPGFVHLTVDEERSKLRAAHLDREFIERGIDAFIDFPDQHMLDWTGDQAQDDWAEILEWDEAIRQVRVVLQGMEDANLERKYKLGSNLLTFYGILKELIRTYPHLRPHLEAMQEAYRRSRNNSAKGAKKKKKE